MEDELIRNYFIKHVVDPDAYCGPNMEIPIPTDPRAENIWA